MQTSSICTRNHDRALMRRMDRAVRLPQLHHPHMPANHAGRFNVRVAAADVREATSPSTAADAPAATSGCPVLAALNAPPTAAVPWWRRLDNIMNPESFQRLIFSEQEVATIPAALGFPETVAVGNGDEIKRLLQSESDGMTRQAGVAAMGRQRPQLMGTNSLISVQDPLHKRLRGLISPGFTGEALAVQVPRMVTVVGKYLARWADTQRPVQAYEEMRLLTFEFIIKLVLGNDFSDEYIVRLSGLYKTWVAGLFNWPWINLPFTDFGKALKVREQLTSEFQVLVDQARAKVAAGQQVEGVLGNLVAAVDEEGNRLTDDQIKDNLLLVLFAGYDTSSTTLTRMLSVLQHHPEVLQQLREEQAGLVAKHGEFITNSVLKDMAYAEAVIRETLRLHPVVTGLFRQSTQEMEVSGHKVAADKPLYTAFWTAAQQDPRWVDATGELAPGVFNPSRMLTPEGKQQGWLVPFGFGPRFCVGYALAMNEMKVFLALLSRHYKYTCDDNTEWKQAVGRYPVNGLPTTMTRL